MKKCLGRFRRQQKLRIDEHSWTWALLRAIDYARQHRNVTNERCVAYIMANRYFAGKLPIYSSEWGSIKTRDEMQSEIGDEAEEKEQCLLEAESFLQNHNLIFSETPPSLREDLRKDITLTNRGDTYMEERLRAYGPVGQAEDARATVSAIIAASALLVSVLSFGFDVWQTIEVGHLQTRIDGLDTRMRKAEGTIGVKADLSLLNERISNLTKEHTQQREAALSEFEERIGALERVQKAQEGLQHPEDTGTEHTKQEDSTNEAATRGERPFGDGL